LRTVGLKLLCREAGVEKVDAGPRGVLFAFRNNSFANPAKLIEFIQKHSAFVKLRPDHRLLLLQTWETDAGRLGGVGKLVDTLARMAA